MSGSVLLLVISIVLLVLCIGAAAVSVFFIIIKRTQGSAGADVCCPSCGAKQRAGTNFCAECGAQLPVSMQAFCTECGTRFEAGMAFCPNCGKPAQAAASAPAKRSKAPVIAACASVVMMIPLIVLIAVSSADLGSSNSYLISDRYSDDDDYSRRGESSYSDNGGYESSYSDNNGYESSYGDYDNGYGESSYIDNGGYGGGSVYVPTYTSCLKCHGTGICPVCNGRGGMSYNTYGQDDDGWVECAGCHGGRLCPRCNGTGRE